MKDMKLKLSRRDLMSIDVFNRGGDMMDLPLWDGYSLKNPGNGLDSTMSRGHTS